MEDLREHIYKAAARLLLSVGWLPEEIGDSEKIGAPKKYDRKEVCYHPSCARTVTGSRRLCQLGQIDLSVLGSLRRVATLAYCEPLSAQRQRS